MASEDKGHLVNGAGAGNLPLTEKEVFTFEDVGTPDIKVVLKCMQEEAMLTDFTLMVGNKFVRCHKVALAACCQYFYDLFKSDQVPPVLLDFTDHNVSPNVLEPLVEFIYTSQIEIDAKYVKDLCLVCNVIQLDNLRSACDGFIARKVQPANVMGLHAFARSNKLEMTLTATKECMLERLEEIVHQAAYDEYEKLSQEALIEWVSNDKLCVPNEDVAFQLVENWFKENPSRNTEAHIVEVLANVRLTQCTSNYLEENVRKSFLVRFESCRKFLDEAFNIIALKHGGASSIHNERTRTRRPVADDVGHFLVGGVSERFSSEDCWKMDKGDSYWRKWCSDIPEGQYLQPYFFRAAMDRDDIVITGGSHYGWKTSSRKCWAYDSSDWRWYDLATMIWARAGHGMLVIADNVYVFGGYSTYALNSVEKLNLQDEWAEWEEWGEMPHAVYPAHAFHIRNHIYVISCKQQITQTCDTQTWTWKVMSNPPQPNYSAAMISIRDDIYVVGGQQGMACMHYNTMTDQWTLLNACNSPHVYCSAMVIKGRILACGGATDFSLDTTCKNIEEYNIATGQWRDSSYSLPDDLCCHVILPAK